MNGGNGAYSWTKRIEDHWEGIEPLRQFRLRSLNDKV